MISSSNHLNHIDNLFKGPNGSWNRQQDIRDSGEKSMVMTIKGNVKEFIEGADPEKNDTGSVIHVKYVIIFLFNRFVWLWST